MLVSLSMLVHLLFCLFGSGDVWMNLETKVALVWIERRSLGDLERPILGSPGFELLRHRFGEEGGHKHAKPGFKHCFFF